MITAIAPVVENSSIYIFKPYSAREGDGFYETVTYEQI